MTTLPRHFAPDTSPALPPHAGRIGLRVFMAVVTTLFSLLILAYAMRMREPDWMPVPHPALLWWNTGVLALASVAMEGARRTDARRTPWLLAAMWWITPAFVSAICGPLYGATP